MLALYFKLPKPRTHCISRSWNNFGSNFAYLETGVYIYIYTRGYKFDEIVLQKHCDIIGIESF